MGIVGAGCLGTLAGNVAKADGLSLETIDGTVYTDVVVKRSLPTTVAFTYSGGIASVPAGSLTDESLSKLGLNPANNPDFKEQRGSMAMKENLKTLKKNRQTISGAVGTGQSIKTKDITDINPVTLLVTEDGVPRRIDLSTLPKDVQEELGYDPVKAAEYAKAKTEAEQAAALDAGKVKAEKEKADLAVQAARAEADKKAAEEAAKASAPVNAPSKIQAIPGKTP